MEKVTDIITEKQINIAWGNANFGADRNAIDACSSGDFTHKI